MSNIVNKKIELMDMLLVASVLAGGGVALFMQDGAVKTGLGIVILVVVVLNCMVKLSRKNQFLKEKLGACEFGKFGDEVKDIINSSRREYNVDDLFMLLVIPVGFVFINGFSYAFAMIIFTIGAVAFEAGIVSEGVTKYVCKILGLVVLLIGLMLVGDKYIATILLLLYTVRVMLIEWKSGKSVEGCDTVESDGVDDIASE